jgi:predicted acetyltransferase
MAEAKHIEVRGASNEEDVARVNDLVAKVHTPNYCDSVAWLETMGANTPGFCLEHCRMAYAEGALAGALRMRAATIRIGRARLKMGGIGWVSTLPAFRKQGVCTALVEDALAYMHAQDYHVSMLFAMPNLYHRYGFTVTLPDYTVSVEAAGLPVKTLSSLSSRKTRVVDLPALQHIHGVHEGPASASLVRSTADFKNQWHPSPPTTPWWPDWKQCRVLSDAGKKIQAYLMPQQVSSVLHFKEVGVSEPAYCGATLREAVRMARKAGASTLCFHVPPYHPFAHYLTEFDSRHTTEHFCEREGMMRFIDTLGALRAMIPEWEFRLGAAAEHEIALNVEGQVYRIQQTGRRITVHADAQGSKISLKSGELVRLLTGHTHADALWAAKKFRLPQSTRDFFQCLFPKRHPFVWPIDHF